MKELEKEFIEERRNLQERKQRQLEEETKMNQRLMDKLEEVQEMQRRQQELWERGLKQSQRSSSEEAETPLILKEGPGASSKWRSPSAERLREKCLQEKKEKEKEGLKLEKKEKAEPSPLDEEDEEDEKSESSSKESASKDSKPKTVDPNDLWGLKKSHVGGNEKAWKWWFEKKPFFLIRSQWFFLWEPQV